MGKIKATKAALEKAAKAALDSSTAARMKRAAEQGHSVARGEKWYHGSASPGVPVEMQNLTVGGVPVYTNGRAVDYSPHKYTDKPTARDFARANLQEKLLINESDLNDAAFRSGDTGLLSEVEKNIDEMISSYREEWPELVPELERIKRGISAGGNRVSYSGGPSHQGIEAFDPNAFQDGLYGRGVYMTDSPEIAGGGIGNEIADLGYATSADLTKLKVREGELLTETAQLKQTLASPEVASDPQKVEIYAKWIADNEQELSDLGKTVTGKPTVYPLSHRVEHPWLPEKNKFKRKDIPVNRLTELLDAMDSKGKNPKGKWPMSDEYIRHVMGNEWVNGTLQEMGYDGIKHTGGLVTGAPEHNVMIAFDPSRVRSVNAQFDPAKKDSADLLAGLAGAATIGAAVAPEDAEAGVITRGGKKLIEAWHGSPHKFDKFDISKIGTGEGAQAYGHGLYFADSDEVAKQYRDNLGSFRLEVDGQAWDSSNPRHQAVLAYRSSGFDRDKAIERLRMDADNTEAYLKETGGWDYPSATKDFIERDRQAAAILEAEGVPAHKQISTGALYRTEIDVDPDTLLDWDKPLSEQPANVKKAVDDLVELYPPSHKFWHNKPALADKDYWRGQDIYKVFSHDSEMIPGLENPYNPAAASDVLNYKGIPGIRYKDGVSRGHDGGTYNYVMFDDKPISITERGSADPALLAATATAAGIAALDSEDYDPLREIKRRQVSSAVGDFARRRESKRRYWQQHRADLLDAVSRAANFTFEAIDMPYRGYLGLAGVAGGLASGQGLDAALQMGATNATRPVEETTYNLGQAAADATGSPAVGAAVHAGLLMGTPL